MVEPSEQLQLLPPVSAEAPCGPDLDLEGDGEFLNYLASTEAYLPSSYFAFDRKSINFPTILANGRKLLGRTLDLRLLVMLVKLSILDRDLNGFSFWLSEIARLLAQYWDDVHPRGEDGDFGIRAAQLDTLDVLFIILPLQDVPLATSKREGTFTFRAHLVALDEAALREGEAALSGATIDNILDSVDLDDLKHTLAALRATKDALDRIRTIWIDKVGFGQAPAFNALAPLVERMASFVQVAVGRRDPSEAAPAAPTAGDAIEGEPIAAAPTQFASIAEVDAALAGALAYFARSEPSSAAVLLIGQARQLLGKNIYEVMKVLAPSQADAARVFVGGEPGFSVPVSSVGLGAEPGDATAPPPVEPAASRAAALTLVDAVAAHLRKVEPSSPVPFLLDRARGLASRDFLGLLKELLSEDALTQMRQG